MNDFTKAQLQDIAFALDTVYMGNSELRVKVQKMIDDYDKNKQITEYRKLIGDVGYE